MKSIVVFDLDGTVIDSRHRTPANPDGTLNLEQYLKFQKREYIFKDTLLPLANVMKRLYNEGHYIVVCTARIMSRDDLDYLEHNQLNYHSMQSRLDNEDRIKDSTLKTKKLLRLKNLKQFAKPWLMFDDAPSVIKTMREIGIHCLNAKIINERLAT